jgi:hypothetical protein
MTVMTRRQKRENDSRGQEHVAESAPNRRIPDSSVMQTIIEHALGTTSSLSEGVRARGRLLCNDTSLLWGDNEGVESEKLPRFSNAKCREAE